MERQIDFWSVPARSSLEEFEQLGLEIVRPCRFSFVAKILTPLNDILVPLAKADAIADLCSRPGIAGVLATRQLASSVPESLGLAIVDDPMRSHHEIHTALARMPGRLWQDFATRIDRSAQIHPSAYVASTNVQIGPDAIIMPGAVIHERTCIGAAARIHAHAVVASDAYEIIILDGCQRLRPQTGGVEIGNQCEIGPSSVITRSAFGGATSIERNSVLDANVTISHDCRIGSNVRIGGGSWIGGRVAIGESASLGPNCTIGNGLTIGERANVALGAVVTRPVGAGAHVSGNFAIDHARMIDHLRRIR